MKKVFVFTLLMVMSVSFAGTSIDAAKKDKEDPIVEETPIVEDGPVSMLVSCPPGVPCDDHGGGTGGGSYDYREDPIVYPSKVEYYITTANKSVSTFDSSDYTVSEGNSSFSYNGLLYIPQDGTISRDSCYGLGGNYYPSTRNTIGRDIEITDYFVDVQGINYSKTIGDLRIVYLHEYYINGDSAHHVYEIYDNCKKYDVFENQFTGNANMINISLVEFTTWMNNEYYVITVDANTFLNRYDEYNSKLTLEEKSEIIDDVMFGLTVLTAGASMAEVALYVAGISVSTPVIIPTITVLLFAALVDDMVAEEIRSGIITSWDDFHDELDNLPANHPLRIEINNVHRLNADVTTTISNSSYDIEIKDVNGHFPTFTKKVLTNSNIDDIIEIVDESTKSFVDSFN